MVGTLTTTDPDAGDTLTYALVTGTGSTDNASFNISGNQLQATNSLNFETKSSYSVRVSSTDQGGLFTEKAFTIAVTNVNESPTDVALTGSAVAENTALNTEVGTLLTTDEDIGDTHTYALVPGIGDTDNGAFTLSDGVLLTAADFDYEAKDTYSIRVQATDSGGLTYEKALVISVTDVNEAPTAVALTGAISSLNENTSTTTRIKLADIAVTDDALGTNTLSLSGTDAAKFEIEGTELFLKAGVVLDHEVRNSYAVTVAAQDASLSGSTPVSTDYVLTVADINEQPTAVALDTATIPENTASGTAIGALTTTDEDAGDTFTYSLVAGNGDADNGSFAIVGDELRTSAAFDFESKSSYTIRVRTTDSGGLSTEESFTITVTDVNEAPTAVSLTGVVSAIDENTSTTSRTKIADVVVTDDALGTNALTLSGRDAANFELDGTELFLKAGVVLDHEAQASFTVTVSAEDSAVAGSAAVTAATNLTINDLNEAPTAIGLSSASVAESSAVGSVVGNISTTDEDVGDTFTYALVSGTGDTDNASFEIVGGELRTTEVFDYDRAAVIPSAFALQTQAD